MGAVGSKNEIIAMDNDKDNGDGILDIIEIKGKYVRRKN
jgi:hypothetical protein